MAAKSPGGTDHFPNVNRFPEIGRYSLIPKSVVHTIPEIGGQGIPKYSLKKINRII